MIQISEKELLDAMKEYIRGCDVDELCRIAEEMFGGKEE